MATRKKQPAKGTELLVQDEASLPDNLASEVEGLEGLGYSERQEDALIPILGIIQEQSGEAKKKHEKYVEGIEAGMLCVRAFQRFFSGEDGNVLVQPCGYDRVWVEWEGEPGDGFPANQYPFEEMPDGCSQHEDPDSGRMVWRTEGGNRLVDTRYHYCKLVEADGGTVDLVIPFAGTNHTVSRQWTQMMKQRIPGTQQMAPAWFKMYRVRTTYTQRGNQSWYKFAVSDAGWVGDPVMRAEGRKMYEAVTKREIIADVMSDVEVDGAATDDAPI